jgi:hypothetical protein
VKTTFNVLALLFAPFAAGWFAVISLAASLLAASLLVASLLAASVPAANAQVMINQAALDQLAGVPPTVIAAPPEIRQPPRKVAYRPIMHRHVAAPTTAPVVASSRVPRRVSVAPKAAPAMPAAPRPTPPQAQLAFAKPVIPKPASPASAEVTFAAGGSDLPTGIIAELKPFCTSSAPAGPITIDAYAAADPSDPSAAPRLSMARAFALRDALMACGIPSASIIPRADGAGKNPDIAHISVAP